MIQVQQRFEWSSFNLFGKELDYLTDALNSKWVSGGEYVEKLETAINNVYVGSIALTVSNGTAALQLAFQTLGLQRGDRVIVPGFSFQAATNVLIQLGGIPVFCDVDSLTWNQTLESIQYSETGKVVGLVVVHNYGRSADIQRIVNWAREKKIWVIEDCAEAWFSVLGDQYLGQFGEIATFSMHATKTISCGEGGVVLFNNKSLVEKAKLLRSHGLNRNKTHYLHEVPGNNYRLSNLLCAVAYGQFECYKDIVERQERRASAYQKYLNDHWAVSQQQQLRGSKDSVWAFAIRLNSRRLRITRDEVLKELSKQGIEARPGFYPASSMVYNQQHLGNQILTSESVAKDIIVLPCSSRLSDQDIKLICNTLKNILDEHRVDLTNYAFVNLKQIECFAEIINKIMVKLGSGDKSFRYFKKRNFDVIKTHLASIALVRDQCPVGYGHIELVEKTYWLGIAVIEDEYGNGCGQMLLNRLLNFATQNSLEKIDLKVDRTNERALRFYKKNSFYVVENKSDGQAFHMQRSIV